jgi:hypothetical protein
VWQLTLKFRGDPVQALVVLGRVEPDKVHELNFDAIVKHAPSETLTAELHRRALEQRRRPRRADTIGRQSFRLTSKER